MSNYSYNIDKLKENLNTALSDLLKEAELKTGDILVVGCSTSEILGEKIGKASDLTLAHKLLPVILNKLEGEEVFPAFQCCEHLNRSLVISADCYEEYEFERVTVKPNLEAGGAMSTAAYEKFSNPIVVEEIKAQAGIDIGDTFIGMHLQSVVIPVRSEINCLGEAHLTMARTRSKLVGGPRASYP